MRRHGLSWGLWAGILFVSPAYAELPRVGSKIEKVTFKDIRWVERSLADFGERKVIVLVFTDARCPVAAKYAPRLSALAKEYEARGVQFAGIYASAADTVVGMAADALEKKLAFPVYKDFNQSSVKALGVTRTPEVAVLDSGRILTYRGRIDDQFRAAGEAPVPGREHLREALDAVLAGKKLEVAETTPEGCLLSPIAPADFPGVNYAEHIAPILQRSCQECHRPGQPAPFSLLSYEDVSRRASMIREVVEERRMPPAYNDPRHGHFINVRSLSEDDIHAVRAWAAAGAPRGDLARAPKPIAWPSSAWRIGEPDLVLEIPQETRVPATGFVDYKYPVLAPAGSTDGEDYVFAADTWVQGIQILPGNHAAVHHANLYIVLPPPLEKIPTFLTGHVPGGEVTRYGKNAGVLVPQGSRLRLQIHYVTSGKETTDRTRVGIVYARETIRWRTKCLMLINNKFKIPPYDPAFEMTARGTFADDALGIGLYIHMHVRGKDMTFLARYPDGKSETLLSVPNYSFDWQISYRWPQEGKRFPAGTVIETVSHYDNSPLNPFNPDPSKTVREGQQTHHEMNYGYFFYIDEHENLEVDVDPKTGRAIAKGSPRSGRI